jgi:hypothetical protein
LITVDSCPVPGRPGCLPAHYFSLARTDPHKVRAMRRAPGCLEASSSAVRSLIKMLKKTLMGSEDALDAEGGQLSAQVTKFELTEENAEEVRDEFTKLLTEESAQELRDAVLMLVRLLRLNIDGMVNHRLVLPEDCAEELHSMVASCLAIDVQQYPFCAEMCDGVSELYTAGQKYFLRTASAQVSAAQELIRKLQNPKPPAITLASQPEPAGNFEPEPESPSVADCADAAPSPPNGELQPVCFVESGNLMVTDSPGSLRGRKLEEAPTRAEPPTGVAAYACSETTIMSSSGRFALELRLAADSVAPSAEHPQGFGSVMLGIQALNPTSATEAALW